MKERTNHYGKSIINLLGSSVTIKIMVVGILTFFLLYPATMLESLIREREDRHKEAIAEISSKLGGEQTIMGPVISVPCKTSNNIVWYTHFLPDTLHITGKVSPEIRYRGIFEAVLYNGRFELTGDFLLPQIEEAAASDCEIQWSKATIYLGVSDMRGMRKPVAANVNDKELVMSPGLDVNHLISSGVSAGVVVNGETKKCSFRFSVDLNGSDGINFVPLGKSTTVSLSSKWPNPSFGGAYLPSSRSMSDEGFTATWSILDLNRDYPQQWRGSKYDDQAKRSAFGVGLFTPVDSYQKSMRITKYAILFVALTFVAFLVSEVVSKVRLHPVQYLLIGTAIITFYTLLISLSEHIAFTTAYAVSSLAVILLVAAYAKSILKRTKLAIIVGGVLALVYGYSYWLLQMVDYALVAGSVGLFIVLSVIMFATRGIDWYSIRVGSGQTEVPPEPTSGEVDVPGQVLSEG
ncbi:cell envelope integrity protein CreD [Thermodesulfobacteriota bacterium]